MINATQHKKNNVIPTIRVVTCPECKKDRLGKYEDADGSVAMASEETVDVREEKRYLEVCGFCVEKYCKADERFVMSNMRKLSKAFQGDKLPEGESDHKDFSLN